jgi:NTP pyrophosphatase (non-canonical NTP hydrolase)
MRNSSYEIEVAQLLKNSHDIHLVAGLASETGEVCAVFQKSSYKNLPVDLQNLAEELGDVLFYTAAIANKYGMTLQELQDNNIKKLRDRHASV